MSKFHKELEQLINKHCIENESNTPDFILANYLMNCLMAYNTAVNQRTKWYGYKDWDNNNILGVSHGKG